MPDTEPDGLDFSHVAGGPGSYAPDAFRAAVPVEVVAPVESVVAPAVLGDVLAGTDRLLYVPRLRLSEPVVYVARDPKTGQVLYVGMTGDLDARRVRHEAEAERGHPGRSSGSNVVPGAFGVLRADWFAVPVEAAYARRLETALKAVLRPVLDKGSRKPLRLNAKHAEALEAAGWAPEAAERIVALSRSGML